MGQRIGLALERNRGSSQIPGDEVHGICSNCRLKLRNEWKQVDRYTPQIVLSGVLLGKFRWKVSNYAA
jgi:hypothetical protein